MKAPQISHISLRVVFYKEEDNWIAHCLDFDLLADGATKVEAFDILIVVIWFQVQATLEDDNPRNLLSPAPGKFFEMFANGKDIVVSDQEFYEQLLAADCSQICIVDELQVREYPA